MCYVCFIFVLSYKYLYFFKTPLCLQCCLCDVHSKTGKEITKALLCQLCYTPLIKTSVCLRRIAAQTDNVHLTEGGPWELVSFTPSCVKPRSTWMQASVQLPLVARKAHAWKIFHFALNLSALKPKAASLETNMSHLRKINCDNDINITLDGSEAIMLH